MNPEQWEKVSEIFHAASALDPDERPAFLDRECNGNEEIRLEVESLIAADRAAAGFISEPAVNLAFSPEEAPSLSGAFLGHYRIIKSIGSGGMGEVYLATDTRLARSVAIKRLPFPYSRDPNLVQRFRNEAKAAATLNHPNVATVYSVEEFGGKPFITMEYIEGRTLSALTPPNGLDMKTFLDWFVPLADGVRQAHERGVTHRDIKPGNIMISDDGTPKILDFGLARISTESRTNGGDSVVATLPGHAAGTPAYMSPEQAEGKDLDQRSDIFSFGVVMYEAITGKRPFSGESNNEVVSNLLKSEPEPVSALRSDVPKTLQRLIHRCLEKRRREGFRSMQEVSAILSETRAFIEMGSSGRSFARRLYRESVERPKTWLFAAAAGVLLVGFVGWYYFSRLDGLPAIRFEKMTMRRLSDTDNVGYAEISPDGRSVAFATFEDDGTRALWMRRVDDRNALRIVAPQPIQYWGGLAISDDGGQVFYITAGLTATSGTLYRVSSLGGPSRKLVEPANDVGGISPDGQRILFVRYGEQSRIISASAIDGSDEQVILTAPSNANFRDPKFSPDGRFVYYIRLDRVEGIEYWSVEAVPKEGGQAKQFFRQKERISEIAMLKDASGLLMTAVDPASNLQQIFHLSLPSGTRTRVTNDLFFYFGISVDRDGRNVLASQQSNLQRVWVGESSNLSGLKPLDQQLNASRSVDWTPDGRIVYDAYENNVSHVWISDADGKNLQRLTPPEYDDAEPRVSSDGRYVVFSSKRSGRSQVWRMNIDGSGQALLADVSGVTQSPRFEADGRTVVFDWHRERDQILASVPVTGGEVQELTQFGVMPNNNSYYWASSPDGMLTAYSIWDEREQRTKVAVRSSDAPEATILSIWPSLIFDWMPDGKSLYYRERQAAYQPGTEVLKVDIPSGKTSVLVSTAPEHVVDLTFSRDGRRVALVRGRNMTNAVILSPAPSE